MTGEGKEVQLLYRGVHITLLDKRSYAYIEITEGLNNGEPMPDNIPPMYFKKKLSKGRPGAIFMHTLERDGDNVTISIEDFSSHLGTWENREDVIRWQTKSDANEAAIRERNSTKKEAGANLPKEALEPIRQAYASAGWQERQQILAAVIRYLTG